MYVTTQRERRFRGEQTLVSIKANGGSVLFEVEHQAGVWVASDTISADFVGAMYFGFANVRITPSGGATAKLHFPEGNG